MKTKLLFLSVASVTSLLAAMSMAPKTSSVASTTASVPTAFYHADPGVDCTVSNTSTCGRDDTGQHDATVPVTDSTNFPGLNFSVGKIGQAFHFTGPVNIGGSNTGTYVDFGDWWTSESFTIAMWMKDDASPMSPQSTSATVIALAHDAGSNDWSITYNNSVGQYTYAGADGAQITFNIPSATWVQLTITRAWDGTTGVTNLYLNGQLAGSATKSNSVLGSPPINSGIRAGADFNLTTYWKGEIDELRFYNNVITSDELAALQPDFNAVRDFFRYTNPAPTPSSTTQPWQYGYSATDGTGFTNYTVQEDNDSFSQEGTWINHGSDMAVVFNGSGQNQSYNICTLQEPDVLGLFPGNDGRKTVVRWTAPASGEYSIQGRFQNIDETSSDVSIVQNGNTASPLFSDEVDGGNCHDTNVTKPFSLTAAVTAGDTIDFRVGWGDNNNYSFDGTGLAVTITKAGPPITVTYDGKLRDRVGQGDAAITPDGFLDGTFTVQLQPGSGNQAVVSLDINRGDGNEWNTIPNDAFWVVGAASTLDAPLFNAPDGTVNFPVPDGAAIKLFVSDNGDLFAAGKTFAATVNFANGTSSTASVTISAATPTPTPTPTPSACPAGETNCGGQCVDLQTDVHNCGSCGNVCPPGWLCSAGGCINPNASPTPTPTPTPMPPPPHGGLSQTGFAVDGSDSPQSGLADTVLQFTAQQSGTPADLVVRVQWGTSSNGNDPSWTDLSDGNNGHMSFDPASGNFVLSSLSYPKQDGVYFRAISSASGYNDSISTIIGPFDLASTTPHLGPTKLYVTGNGPNADMYFQADETNPPAGVALRIQGSVTPSDENSWGDLNDGNSGYMNQSTNPDFPNLFVLAENNLPSACGVYFRVVASLNGYTDSISNVVGPFDLIQNVPPSVSITAPNGFGGNPYDPSNPWIVEAGNQTFTATVSSNNTVDVLRILSDYDQLTLVEYDFPVGDGTTTYTATFNLDVGDHVVEGIAADEVQGCSGETLHSIGRNGTSPVYIRVVPQGTFAKANGDGVSNPLAPRVFHAVQNGQWTDSQTWVDQNGIPGTPTEDDSVIIDGYTIHFNTHQGFAKALFLNDATLVADVNDEFLQAQSNLTVNSASVFGGLGVVVGEGAVGNLQNDSSIFFQPRLSDPTNATGALIVIGTLNVHGSGGVLGPDQIVLLSNGRLFWLPPLQSPLNIPFDPTAGTRVFLANKLSNAGEIGTTFSYGALIGSDGAGLIGSDGAGLIGSDGAGLIGNAGGAVIAQGGGNVIAAGGGNVIAQGGGNVIAQGGGNVIAQGGGNVIAAGGGNFHGPIASRDGSNAPISPGSGGFIQTGGNTNLNSCTIIGSLTLNGGTLSGSGVIQGDVTNSGGMISPGHSAPGTITVKGNFNQGPDGSLLIKDGGKLPSQFDQLQVDGSAALGGKLGVYKTNGFTPDPQDTFSPLGYNSVNGSFNSISANAAQNAMTNPDGLLLAVDPNVANPFTISADALPGEGGSVTGVGPYDSGSQVTVTATPNGCYSFVNWTEDGSIVSTSPVYSFTASADRTLVANFTKTEYVVAASASPSEGGSVTGGGNHECGSAVTLQAVANSPCYSFSNWTENGAVVSTSATYSFTAESNRNLVANFTKTDTTPPTINAPENMVVRPQKTKGKGPKGAVVSFNVSAVDPEDGPVPATANPPSGSFFPLGTTTVTVSATDNCNNTSTSTFTVTVGNARHGRR